MQIYIDTNYRTTIVVISEQPLSVVHVLLDHGVPYEYLRSLTRELDQSIYRILGTK